ncbi:hypothetical protein GCM10016272_07360 [Psychrobacter glaciei]|uniref:DNA polymerase III subunit psi n=1 Tax=Psychrobacter glaciei TaxID=619771 RepID=A0ABQ3GPS2_9GAMM|nr:hypothetical protein [Psychrobacter glaciei]GHD28257.1 hypothetical protein GCM10016272_07360 [Psychrobacter glaciei]
MSDIQDPLIVLQHRMQQRQILAMMGINQWVQPSSATINMADISAPIIPDPTEDTSTQYNTSTQAVPSDINIEQSSIEQQGNAAANVDMSNISFADSVSALVNDEPISHYYHDANDIGLAQPDAQSPVTYSFDTSVPDVPVKSLVDEITQQTTAAIGQSPIAHINSDDSFKKVTPFDLQGGRYGDWVILVDIQALNNDSQKLWKNITQALSITCETTSFPICEGMDTAELANASLAGYVFKIGRSEEIKVAALTALPEGLEHPHFTTVPTLEEMLADSSLKRQLWERLSG